ncbi:hypothetical protein ACU60R_04240 [Klebsiella aerogenes]
MTNNQLTDQKLTKIVESAEAVISALAGHNDDVHPDDSTKMCRLWDALNDDDATPEVVLEMAKELQERRKAAMDSEPDAYIFKHPSGKLFWVLTDESNKGRRDVMPAYASPQPAPVVPVEMNSDKAWGELKISAEDCQAWSEGWNACRAAMLSAVPQEVK